MDTQAKHTAVKLGSDEMLALLGAMQPQEGLDRRGDVRHLFSAPVTLHQPGNAGKQLSAFSREISCSGIGLLHCMPIDQGTVCIVSIAASGVNVSKFAEAVWCKAIGDVWYLSGWRFVTPL